MKERFITAFEDTLAANRGGEIRNLLITDGNAEFLDEAQYALRRWTVDRGFNLVEIDEKDGSWLPEIQSRELFEKLNRPNTVLLVKNYSTVYWMQNGDDTLHLFLRDLSMKRHYGCGNDFVPSDELPNLLFVVAINDLSKMRWFEDEYLRFNVMHEDDDQRLWVNNCYCHSITKMHPVMSIVNKVVYWISDDERLFSFDVVDAFRGLSMHRLFRHCSAEECGSMICSYLEKYPLACGNNVECLILAMGRVVGDKRLVLDAARLKKIFPALKTVCCNDTFEVVNAENAVLILDPFELGERAFKYAQDGDFETANRLTRELWALDGRWARFFREVALDFQLPCDEQLKRHPDINIGNTGLDKLFRIYLLGWYFKSGSPGSFNEDCKVHVKKHQSFEKAMDLLAVRFKNWGPCHISEKLRWDLSHCAHDADFKYETFAKVICETERLFPGTLDQLQKDGMEEDEVLRLRALMADESKT